MKIDVCYADITKFDFERQVAVTHTLVDTIDVDGEPSSILTACPFLFKCGDTGGIYYAHDGSVPRLTAAIPKGVIGNCGEARELGSVSNSDVSFRIIGSNGSVVFSPPGTKGTFLEYFVKADIAFYEGSCPGSVYVVSPMSHSLLSISDSMVYKNKGGYQLKREDKTWKLHDLASKAHFISDTLSPVGVYMSDEGAFNVVNASTFNTYTIPRVCHVCASRSMKDRDRKLLDLEKQSGLKDRKLLDLEKQSGLKDLELLRLKNVLTHFKKFGQGYRNYNAG